MIKTLFIDMIMNSHYFRWWATFLAIAFNPLIPAAKNSQIGST